jgi:hypothetical protein
MGRLVNRECGYYVRGILTFSQCEKMKVLSPALSKPPLIFPLSTYELRTDMFRSDAETDDTAGDAPEEWKFGN